MSRRTQASMFGMSVAVEVSVTPGRDARPTRSLRARRATYWRCRSASAFIPVACWAVNASRPDAVHAR